MAVASPDIATLDPETLAQSAAGEFRVEPFVTVQHRPMAAAFEQGDSLGIVLDTAGHRRPGTFQQDPALVRYTPTSGRPPLCPQCANVHSAQCFVFSFSPYGRMVQPGRRNQASFRSSRRSLTAADHGAQQR